MSVVLPVSSSYSEMKSHMENAGHHNAGVWTYVRPLVQPPTFRIDWWCGKHKCSSYPPARVHCGRPFGLNGRIDIVSSLSDSSRPGRVIPSCIRLLDLESKRITREAFIFGNGKNIGPDCAPGKKSMLERHLFEALEALTKRTDQCRSLFFLNVQAATSIQYLILYVAAWRCFCPNLWMETQPYGALLAPFPERHHRSGHVTIRNRSR